MHNPYSPVWNEEEQIWFSECECGDFFEADTFERAEELIDKHSQEVEDLVPEVHHSDISFTAPAQYLTTATTANTIIISKA